MASIVDRQRIAIRPGGVWPDQVRKAYAIGGAYGQKRQRRKCPSQAFLKLRVLQVGRERAVTFGPVRQDGVAFAKLPLRHILEARDPREVRTYEA